MRYYSISPSEMGEIPIEELNKMNEALDIFIAQEILHQFKVSSFPNMSKNDKSVIHKEYHKIAYPSNWSKKINKLSLKEIAVILGNKNGR
jgi:hypothetical protein